MYRHASSTAGAAMRSSRVPESAGGCVVCGSLETRRQRGVRERATGRVPAATPGRGKTFLVDVLAGEC